MKKIFITTLLILSFFQGRAENPDSLSSNISKTTVLEGDTNIRNVEFYKSFNDIAPTEVSENDFMMKYLYLCLFVMTLFGCGAIWYVSRLKSKQYEKVIALMNSELAKQKFQSNTFGYILNSVMFPLCLISGDGKIAWANDKFYKLYGKDIKEFDMFVGAPADIDKETIKNCKSQSFYYVKIKNQNGKVVGFKRTLIPLPSDTNGDKNYAISENIEIE